MREINFIKNSFKSHKAVENIFSSFGGKFDVVQWFTLFKKNRSASFLFIYYAKNIRENNLRLRKDKLRSLAKPRIFHYLIWRLKQKIIGHHQMIIYNQFNFTINRRKSYHHSKVSINFIDSEKLYFSYFLSLDSLFLNSHILFHFILWINKK